MLSGSRARRRSVQGTFGGSLRLALGITLAFACVAGADESRDDARAREAAMEEEETVRDKIRDLAREEDLEGIAALVAKSAAKWRPIDSELAAGFVIQMSGMVHSVGFQNRGRASYLAQDMVLKELQANEKLSVAQRAGLVIRLRHRLRSDGRRLTGVEAARERLAHIRLWVDAWARIEATMDPAWDVEGRLDPLPPPPPGYPPRVPPRAIRDPEVREAYERAVRAKRKDRAERIQQRAARATRDELVPKLKLRILTAAKEEPRISKDDLLAEMSPLKDRAAVEALLDELNPGVSDASDGSSSNREGK